MYCVKVTKPIMTVFHCLIVTLGTTKTTCSTNCFLLVFTLAIISDQENMTDSCLLIRTKETSSSLLYVLFRSPVLWTVNVMFCARFFFFLFSQLTFSDVCKPIFSKLFHMTWLYSKKKRCYADFLKVPLTKMRGENPKFRLISRLIATYYAPSLVMWKENRKSKKWCSSVIISLYVHQIWQGSVK